MTYVVRYDCDCRVGIKILTLDILVPGLCPHHATIIHDVRVTDEDEEQAHVAQEVEETEEAKNVSSSSVENEEKPPAQS